MSSGPGSGRRGAGLARGVCRPLLVRLALALIVLAGSSAHAGTISLGWDPLLDPAVTGYRVYYGLAPDAMTSDVDAGPVAEATIDGLAECTTWYLFVRAYNAFGYESVEPSRLVKGWPRPVVTDSRPRSISPGETALLTVNGTNFDPGVPGDPLHPAATIEFSHPGLRVLEVFQDSCRQVRVRVEALPDAEPGWSALTVKNVDVSWNDPMSQPKVFGTLEQALEVLAPPSNDPPSVTGSSPAPGTLDVPLSVRPLLVFSEPVDPTSVTALTVRLLDEGDALVVQAAGSPSVRAAEVALLPAEPLRAGTAYRIEVIGGPDGVKDLTGLPLATDWRLDPAFTTASAGGNATATIVDSHPVAGQRGVSVASREVRVRFDRDMGPLAAVISAGALQKAFRVLSGRKVLPHAPGSPAFEDDGQTVVIRLRAPLQAGLHYATVVELATPKLRAALGRSGHADLAMLRTWSTSPQWETVEALVAAEARSDGSDTGIPLVIGGSGPPPQNTAVPIASEFRLTFAEPLVASSVSSSTVRILAGGKPLMLESPPHCEDDQRTVVFRAARPLAPGKPHKIQVRGGAKGVKFQVTGGGAATIGAPRAIDVHFATEDPAATQSQSLDRGE